MPAYDFICDDCNQTFTLKRSFAQAGDPADCPDCASSRHTRKVFSAVAFNLAGGASRPPDPTPAPSSGGCCGGGACGCGH